LWAIEARECKDYRISRQLGVGQNGIFCVTIKALIEIEQYIDRLGRNAFDRWFNRLSDEAQARIATSLARVTNGNFSNSKGVGAGVEELRIDFGPGYRIYFGRDGAVLVILLGGGTKKRQQDDIALAQTKWNEYKKRKQEQSCR
jgi:putative addiction module killer protein